MSSCFTSVFERRADLRDIAQSLLVEPRQHGAGAGGADRGEPHAVGRQHAGQRMDQHRCHAERVGDEAGMLAAGAAKRIQHIVGDVVAALDRDRLDRVRHVLDRDPDEAVGDLFRRAPVAELARERLERLAHGVRVERLVLLGPENVREKFGLQFARHHIGVGDGERAAAPVGEGPRIGARRVRARRGSARRRNAGSSRRPPRPCGPASSARARGRPRPRCRSSAHRCRRNGRHRSRCRPCRSR